MEECYFFYRSDLHCLLAKHERSKEWYGFVGFMEGHPYHGSAFKTIKNCPIAKMSINNSLDTVSGIYKDLWYMGFCSHPYSKEKTMEDLKRLVDNIQEELNKDG